MTDNNWGGDAPEPPRDCLPLLAAAVLATIVLAGLGRLLWALVVVTA